MNSDITREWVLRPGFGVPILDWADNPDPGRAGKQGTDNMETSMRRAFTFLIFTGMSLALAGCGGGGGGGNGPAPASNAPATVGVLITDAPVGKWDQAIATITSVTLIGDDGPVTLFSGSETLDLLQLGDFSELFAVSDAVPQGTYSKIRLQLSDLVLNDIDPATEAITETVHPQLVGNGKIDLNPRGPFALGPGEVIFIELDFDMGKSLKITETGNGKLIVRPVVFVDIRKNRAQGRLSRVHGEITASDPASGELRLCQTEFASRLDDHDGQGDDEGDHPPVDGPHCVTVSANEGTGIFGEDGLPQVFNDLAIGDEATVIGRLRRLDNADGSLGDDDQGDDHHVFALDVFVIEEGPLGTYARIRGIASSGVDGLNDRFNLAIAPGQGLGTATTLPVQLFGHTHIFSRAGDELGREDIVTGQSALVDGVVVIGTDDLIRSPLIILDIGPPPGESALRGEVVSLDTEAESLIVSTESGYRCVDAAGADVFLVNSDDGLSSTRGDLSDLHPGQDVAIFGEEGVGGCLIADTILAEE